MVLTQCYQTRDYSGRSFVKVCQVPPPDTEHRPSDPFINGGHCRRSTLAPTVTNSCENCSPARFEGWRGLGLQSRLIAGVSPIAAIAAAPPVGFPRLVQYSGAMAPIPVYGGQGQCQPAGPHILLCTAHIIQPRTSLPPWLDFQLLSSVTASPYCSQLSHVQDKWQPWCWSKRGNK